jgi:5-methylcytosine-specific restriction enzyme A
MLEGLFINGIFQDVLEEIITAQKKNYGLICYLQPYSKDVIKHLKKNQPNIDNRIRLYISTSKKLSMVSYTADIVGWENKKDISKERLDFLYNHIIIHQPGEKGGYIKTDKSKDSVNIISVLNMKSVPELFSVSTLIKISDGKPYQVRSQAGGWSPVYTLPEQERTNEPINKEIFEAEQEQKVIAAKKDSPEERKNRLSLASPIPEQVQIVSIAYRRNPDVIAEIMLRANGKCEHCGQLAPFLKAKDGSPYLEVHHWIPLSQGGEDTVQNSGALCPNCHRKHHFGQKQKVN